MYQIVGKFFIIIAIILYNIIYDAEFKCGYSKINAEQVSSQLRLYEDRSTTEPQHEEHGGGVTMQQ